jgi:hypothetical protein
MNQTVPTESDAERAKRGVWTCKRNLIAVESEIAAKIQALASLTTAARQDGHKILSVRAELEKLSMRKAEIERLRDEYAQQMKRVQESAPENKLDKLRIACGLSFKDLAYKDESGVLDPKLVSGHCQGKRRMRMKTARIYVGIFKKLGKDLAIEDLPVREVK